MDYIELAKIGGPTIVSIIVLLLVVREFLKFVKHQEDNFSEIIKNHLHSDTEAKNKLEQSNTGLTKMIEQLIRFLEKNNK